MSKKSQKAIRLTLGSNGGLATLDVSGPAGMASMDVDFDLALGLMEELGLLELADEVGGAEHWSLDAVSKPKGDDSADAENGTRMLNIREVAKRTGLSVRTLNRLEDEDDDFPRPRWLSKGRKAWVESEIDFWIAAAREKRVSRYSHR